MEQISVTRITRSLLESIAYNVLYKTSARELLDSICTAYGADAVDAEYCKLLPTFKAEYQEKIMEVFSHE